MDDSNKQIYSDGDEIENTLLQIFSVQKDQDKKIEELIKTGIWTYIYHLDKGRENLLNWYNFDKNASLLEIGAGCGALTGLFLRKLKNVHALELSEMRAQIIQKRYSAYRNLTTIIANVMDHKTKERFDYVTSIGVLEYSGIYIQTENPYLTFLKKLKSFLKPNGYLIIAIENQFGLKYWAGAYEDHTGRLFDSIEDYPNNNTGIRTFGKNSMKNLLNEAGFKDINFYYPMPDYKFPTEIYSDNYKPNFIVDLRPYTLAHGIHQDRLYFFFEERRAFDALIKENIVDLFANSFLIFAR